MFKHPRPVLVFQNDPEHTAFMVDFLRLEGFNALSAYSRLMFLERLTQEDVEAVVLEARGQEVTESLIDVAQSMKSVPVVVLLDKPMPESWQQRYDLQQVVGLVKPASPSEVLENVKMLIADYERQSTLGQVLEVGELAIHPDENKAILAGQPLVLTATELTLLELLVRHPGQALCKGDIYQRVLGREMQRFDRAIDVHVSTLRHKMNEIKRNAIQIESVRGVGYRLVAGFSDTL